MKKRKLTTKQFKVYRSSKTGKFVTKKYADKHKATTQGQIIEKTSCSRIN